MCLSCILGINQQLRWPNRTNNGDQMRAKAGVIKEIFHMMRAYQMAHILQQKTDQTLGSHI